MDFNSEIDVLPKFKPQVKTGTISDQGIVLYYSNQCPHSDKYVKVIEDVAKEEAVEMKVVKLETSKDAQTAPTPFTTYSIYKDGSFVTNEILTEKKFRSLILSK